jgi:tetrahydromethanopterin S-methyltransferase subunit H
VIETHRLKRYIGAVRKQKDFRAILLRVHKGDIVMHDATYQLRANELDDVLVQTIKNTYREREIIILSKDDYDEGLGKLLHNSEFTEKLQQRIKALDEGKGVAKTLAELEALANE